MRIFGRSDNSSTASGSKNHRREHSKAKLGNPSATTDPAADWTMSTALENPSTSTSAATRSTPSPGISGRGRSSSERSNSNSNSNNKPVDLDDIYDGKMDLYDDSHSDDGSAADVLTETSVSKSSTNDGTTPEDNRMAALVHTMAEKQQIISETFCDMISSMTKIMLSMEEQVIASGADAVAAATAADSSILTRTRRGGEKSNPESPLHTTRAKAQARAHRNVEKALEMQELALAMKAKQARIAQQFETLVHRLEQESLETAQHNQSLQRQLQMARVLLKDEAGVEMEDISAASPAGAYSAGAAAQRHRGSLPHRPPRSSTTRRPGSVRSNTPSGSPDTAASMKATARSNDMMMHPIKEIAFSNTVVDVTEMSNNQAAAADDDEENHPQGLLLKESSSSDEFSPQSQRTCTTRMTSTTTTTTVSENLRILL